MTNADRIRNMTDEELRDFIDRVGEVTCELACAYDVNKCGGMCKDGILQWLKEEVSE